MISKGVNNWDSGLRGACESGHLDIVNLMIEKGNIFYKKYRILKIKNF